MSETEFQFKKVADAVRYLVGRGWQISGKSFYRHVAQGRVKGCPCLQEELDAYAAEYLRPATGVPVNAAASTRPPKGMAAEVLQARKEKYQLDTQYKKFEFDLLQMKYITIDDHVRASCKKLMLVKECALNWIYEHAGEMIEVVNGDQARSSELVDLYQTSVQSYLGRVIPDDRKYSVLRHMPPAEDFELEPILGRGSEDVE